MRPNLLRLTISAWMICMIGACSTVDPDGMPPKRFNTPSNVANAGFNADRLAIADSALSFYVESGELPNVVTFVAKGGEIVHHKAYGFKNLENQEPLKTDNIFRLASQTKAVVTAALLTLYEEGRFFLDDPVSDYIPEFGNPMVLISFDETDTTFTSRPAAREITIRHLLTHTSGIHYGILGSGQGNMMYAKEGIPAVNSMEPITVGEVVKKIASMPLMFDPGERYLYGMNTDVAGYLIEVLSGRPLDIFLKERVFDPLGMKDTYFYLPVEKEERLVTLYSKADGSLVLHPNDTYRNYPVAGARMFLSGGAGLSGTIEDYARFCQMILNKGTFNGNRILSRKTVDMMTTNQIGNLEYGDHGRRFGLGLDIWSKETVAWGLGSEGAMRWGGMYYTDYRIDPAEDLIILFCSNVQPWQGPNIHKIFKNLIYQALE